MKVLITGGGGFVGANLAKHLSDKRNKVTVYDNFSRGNGNLPLLEKCDVVRGELDDICDFLNSGKKFDLIYHFAAQVAVTTGEINPRSDFRINAHGTFNLLQGARDMPVIFASTNKVYGDNVNNVPIVERELRYDFDGDLSTNGIPETFSIDANHHTKYGCSKLTADIYVREYGGVANRFSCMYGPNQFGNEDQGWVSHFVTSKVKNIPVTLYGNGKTVRDLLFIDDVVRLLELEGENIEKIRGEIFNVGGGYDNTVSLLELCDYLALEHPYHGDERPADQKVYYSDINKAKNVLGWAPSVGVYEGVDQLRFWAMKYYGKK